MQIKHIKNLFSDEFNVIIKNGKIYDLQLADTLINLKRENKVNKVKSLLRTNGDFNFSQIKKISSLLGVKINNIQNINGLADLKTNIIFNLNKKFKVKDLFYSMEGDINKLTIVTNENKFIKQYLPEYNPTIVLNNTKIQLIKSKSDLEIDVDGFIKNTGFSGA